jgi:sugar phosphate isomerase/epimerase
MSASQEMKVSLAAWSLHRAFFAREIDQLGMLEACAEFGIAGFELVNTFFPSPQYAYLRHMKNRADELGIELPLIMCDLEGYLGHVEREKRLQAARNHRKWVDIAAVLGCHSIRCNAAGDETEPAALRERCAEALAGLLEYAVPAGIDVVIENHGGLSSDPDWLCSLVEMIGSPHLGTLPDFGNFPPEADKYGAVAKLMPQARAVSAKCYDFGPDGNETTIDFERMLCIVRNAGYSGYVGIEYEGERLPERDGILAAKALLERLL